MPDDSTELCHSPVRVSAGEPNPDPRANVYDTSENDFSFPQAVAGEEHSRLMQLREENPEISDSIRECELLCQALIGHSQISALTASRTMDEAEAVSGASLVFPPLQTQ